MDYAVRHIRHDEWPLLEGFLYEAIYVPEGFEGEIPRSVVYDDPKCRAAFEGFGSLPDDRAVVAVVNDKVVGACWVRTTDEYGHVDDATPSFSISLFEPYRSQGIGTAMMRSMLDELRGAGYARAKLPLDDLAEELPRVDVPVIGVVARDPSPVEGPTTVYPIVAYVHAARPSASKQFAF